MNITQISRPGPGQTTTIHAAASDKIILDFSTQGITLSRADNALIFTFDDGAVIRLDDFYENYHADNIPEFEADGRLVSGAEFFSALGPDLMPAAGPAPVERSSHSAEYSDSALQGGVDHLDGLDMSVQGESVADGALQFDSALTADRGADFGGSPTPTPTPAPTPELPLFPSGPFVRAVLYSPGNSSDPVTTPVFFGGNGTSPTAVAPGDIDFAGSAPGAQYGVTVSLPAGWSSSWVDVSFNSTTGRLEFRLTADGVDEMQRLGLEDESLVDFVHVTVTDRTSGDTFEYNVEFVATDSQIFDSAAHDSKYGGEHLDNIGEFHQGQNNGGSYSVISSMQDDEIIMNETVIGGSSIHASGSADPAHMADDFNTIKLNAGVANTTQDSITHITSADGTLDVADGVIVQGRGAENIIDMGKGSVHVQNASGYGVSATDGGKNAISGGEVVVDAHGRGVAAEEGGSNTVSAQNGDVSIDADGVAVLAHVDATNSISATGGSVTINSIDDGIDAGYGSTNSVTAVDGDITINVQGLGVAAYIGSTNNLSATNGSIRVSTGAGGFWSSANSSTNVDVTNGNLEIDGSTHGIVTYVDSTTTVSVTNGDVNINVDDIAVTASDGSVNNIDVAGGSLVMNVGNDGFYAARDGVNRITVDGDVVIKLANTNGFAPQQGLFASDRSENVVVSQKDISISAFRDDFRVYGLSVDTDGHNSITAKGAVDISVTGGTAAHGMAVTLGNKNTGSSMTGSNTITSDGKTTITATATGSAADSNAYGMSIDNSFGSAVIGDASNTIVSGDDVAINSSSASGNAYGMAVQSSGRAIVTAANTIKADGRVDVNATGNVASAMYASGAQSANSITAASGDVTVSAAGTGSSYGSGFGYGMNAGDSGSNSIITDSGAVKVSGNSASAIGYGMFANSSGSNAAATTSGNVTASGVGASGTGMHATTSGASNAISTESGEVNVSGNAANGNGYGMSATIFGSNSISTENGAVNVSGISKSNNALGMTAVTSGTNTITTESGDVAVSGNGTFIGSGMSASSGSNTITTTSGNVTVTGGNAASSVGHGMNANSTGSSNAINTESGDVTVTGSGKSAYGMYGASSGSNAVSAESGNVTVSGNSTGPVGSSFGYGMYATAGHNAIVTDGGNVTVTGSGKAGYGMNANSTGSSNAITTDSGNITVTGQTENYGYGMYAGSSGHNVIETQSGSITVVSKGSGSDMHAVYATGAGSTNTIKGGLGSSVSLESAQETLSAQGGGKNFITGGDVSVHSTASNSKAVYATGSASENSINALQSVDITSNMHGVSANSGGRNSIKGNDITVKAGNNADAYGVYATGAGTANEIAARSGLVTISAGKHALFAEASGKNTVTGDGGMHVKGLESGLYALGSGSANTITANGGEIVIEAANSNSYAMRAENKGVNTVVGTETVTLGGGKFGMHAAMGGQNSIAGNGVDISATNNALYANGSNGSNSKNIVNAGNGAATLSADSAVSSFVGAQNIVTGASVDIKGTTNGLFSSGAGSNNTVSTGAAGTIFIAAGQRAMHAESYGSNKAETVDGNVTVIGQGTGSAVGYGMSAMSGGNNTITTEGGHVSVSGSGSSGFGMVAKGGGVNTIESASGSPLTVTITASANAAEKAIAMWAEGGGSVNRITGHSQAGGTGDSITLTANNGQGIAMQSANGGKNIITTGAGNDSVTINGNVVGDGNEINLGGGSNTLTLNGAVQPGSLNVLVDSGGTYTLILQESDVESFADRYGDWLDDIVANDLFSGLSSIYFEGWGEGDQSAEELAEFMATFGDILNTLHDAGVSIEPEALSDYLANPSPAASPAALLAEAGAEHHMQDAQHGFGHDDTQDESPLAAHDGPVFMTGGESDESAFSAQPDNTVVHAGILAHDDMAQPGLDEGEHEVEPTQPLFAFLNAPAAGTPTGMSAEEGDASLHDGYLASGESGSGSVSAGLQGVIALTHGDESLDGLFADTEQQVVKHGEASLWYVESGSELHDVALTSMSKITVQDASGEHVFNGSALSEGRAVAMHGSGNASNVMDVSQEVTDSAAREMANY